MAIAKKMAVQYLIGLTRSESGLRSQNWMLPFLMAENVIRHVDGRKHPKMIPNPINAIVAKFIFAERPRSATTPAGAGRAQARLVTAGVVVL